jgi:hypothetical protein
MKKILLLLVSILFVLEVNAQSPEKMSYQAVIRDASNNLVTNQSVGMQISILQGSPSGVAVYVETHNPSTNDNGLVSVEIGNGTVVSGSMNSINWGAGSYFIQTETDPTGGIAYTITGTSELISVPYALYANTAGSVLNDQINDADADSTNEYNTGASLSGTTLAITDGGGNQTVDLSSLQDGTGTDDQNITGSGLTGTDLTIGIEGGSSEVVDLSSLQDGTGTDDQNITGSGLTGTDLTIGIEGGSSEVVDLSSLQDGTGTDDQNITGSGLTGTDLTIGIEGGSSEVIDLSSLQDGTGTDAQTLSFTSPNLSISNGNSVDLSGLTDDGDWVVSSGTNYTNGNDGNIGIGNLSSSQNRWQLTVKDTVDCMLSSDSIDVSELFSVYTRNLNENNTGVGIGFQSTSTVSGVGAAIVHERTSSNSRGKLHFATKSSSSAASEDLPIRLTLDESGRLGIGVTDPTEKLHVYGGDGVLDRGESTGSLTRELTLGGARDGDNVFAQINFQNYDSNDGLADYTGASIRANNGGDNTDNGDLRFFTYDGSLSERMRIDENGLVGIGETSPQATLDVVDMAVIGNISVGSESTDQGTSSSTGLGFTTTPWLYTNAIEAQGERGTGSTLITLGADGTYGANDQIHLVTSGSSQMTIASDGKVGFDQTAPDTDIHIRQSQQSITNGTGGVKYEDSADAADWWRTFHSGTHFSFNRSGTRLGYIDGSSGTYTVTSDARFKKNVTTLTPVLDRVMKMRPVSYHYTRQEDSEKQILGFIAQETLPLFPELVSQTEDGFYGMGYANVGAVTIKAIQEQQEIIKSQETTIQELKEQMLLLAKEVQKLKEAKN